MSTVASYPSDIAGVDAVVESNVISDVNHHGRSYPVEEITEAGKPRCFNAHLRGCTLVDVKQV